MQFRKILSYLNGLPGIIVAVLAALGAFQLYIHQREQRAVERAQWEARLDSLQHARTADSLAFARRDSVRADSIRQWQVAADRARAAAAAAAQHAASASSTLHALVDSNAAAKAALDSLDAAHARQVGGLTAALAFADSIHHADEARLADRDAQLTHLRSDLADMTQRATQWERRAHPGLLRRVIESPVTHAVAFGTGTLLGLVVRH